MLRGDDIAVDWFQKICHDVLVFCETLMTQNRPMGEEGVCVPCSVSVSLTLCVRLKPVMEFYTC